MNTYGRINYVSKIFNYTNELEGFNLSYKDSLKEMRYEDYFENYEKRKSTIFFFLSILTLLNIVYSTLSVNNFSLNIYFYLFMISLFLEIIACFISLRVIRTNKLIFKSLKFLRFINIYASSIVFAISSAHLYSLDIKVKTFYRSFIITNTFYIYYVNFNYLLAFTIPVCNAIYMITLQIFFFERYYLLPEIVGSINLGVFFFFFKKYEHIYFKNFFSELDKNSQCLNYINDLVDALNCMIISLGKNSEVLSFNRLSSELLDKMSSKLVILFTMQNQELKEVNLLSSSRLKFDSDIERLNSSAQCLLKSLLLCHKSENFYDFTEGTSLGVILSELLLENKYHTKEFTKLGYFYLEDANLSFKYYEVVFRKIKLEEEILELMLHDVSEIKMAEKMRVETKYKQKILAKIAHEFKTPLITITSLISKMFEARKSCIYCVNTSDLQLNHINNLSNYTMVLISDIMQYVSGEEKKPILYKVNIKEVLIFCYDVLKTLLECKLFKSNNIESHLT
jgi:hypothetical protein